MTTIPTTDKHAEGPTEWTVYGRPVEEYMRAIKAARSRFFKLIGDTRYSALAARLQRDRNEKQTFLWLSKRCLAHSRRHVEGDPRDEHWLFGSHFQPADVVARYFETGGRCYWCKDKLNEFFQVDHVRPLATSRDNSAANIVVSCRQCNAHRRNRGNTYVRR